MRVFLVFQFAISFVSSATCAADLVCASRPVELRVATHLNLLREIFPENSVVGFVNETSGSYFEVENSSDQRGDMGSYSLTFYTSGFLDLYGVMRSGPAKFCFDSAGLSVHSMGQIQKIEIQGAKLVLGDGGPRKTFSRGVMPSKLVLLHRPISAGGSRPVQKGFANPAQRDEH